LEYANFIVGAAIALLGLFLAHNLRRQYRLKIAEERIVSYRNLWRILEIATPERLDPAYGKGRIPLKPSEAGRLYIQMTKWYYESGNGMMLPDNTKVMFIKAKKRLASYSVNYDDADSADSNSPWQVDGQRRMRELSLLRTQMKLDLDIYGVFYFASREQATEEGADREETELRDADLDFLRACGFSPTKWGRLPWYRRWYRRLGRRWSAYGQERED
jgi:hypothetical protein